MISFRAVVAAAAVIYHDHHVCQCDTQENMFLVSTRRLLVLHTERVARRDIWSKISRVEGGGGMFCRTQENWTSFQFEFE